MEAARAVAGFAASLACGARILQADAHMSAAEEVAADVGMAFKTRVVAHEPSPRNLRRNRQSHWGGRTRIQRQGNARSKPQASSGGQVSCRCFIRRLASHRLCE